MPTERGTASDEEAVLFEILGSVGVIQGDERHPLTSSRQRVVLAALVLSVNRTVSHDTLIEAVWSERAPRTARNQVQTCVSALRRLLRTLGGAAAIDTVPGGYLLRAAPQLVDLHAFRRRSALAAALAGEGRHEAAIFMVREAIDYWRGPACADVDSEVIQARVVHLEEELLAALENHTEWLLTLGRYGEAIGELTRQVARHPLREGPRRQLIQALYCCGRTAEALEVYRDGRREFIDQLGLEPGDELRRLESRILSRDPLLRPSGHRTPAQPVVVPRQLPNSLGDFTGRQRVLTDVAGGLAGHAGTGGRVPMAVLTGASGVGKTVTAVHAAHGLAADLFPDGQLYADLGGSGDPVAPEHVLRRCLRALGVPAPGIPEAVDERAELYRSLLAGRRILLVLDDVATQAQVRPLLPGTSLCAVLMTSRSRVVTPPGAKLVELGMFDEAEAVQLLGVIIGAHRVEAEPAAARRIVELTGGLPLAIRIVGARMATRPHWSLRTMVARLADPRQRLDELVHGELGVRDGIGAAFRSLPAAHRALLFVLSRNTRNTAVPFPARTAATALNLDRGVAAEILEDLADVHLVESLSGSGGAQGTYRIPVLVAVHAYEIAAATGMRSRIAGPEDLRRRFAVAIEWPPDVH
ncbi:BTAD domain-containing putative transcriptional regulator [Streptomyces sp. NPDC001858]